jgi:hypothetical protein
MEDEINEISKPTLIREFISMDFNFRETGVAEVLDRCH